MRAAKAADRIVGVINEDELIWFVREFIVTTETTVEDDRPAYERLVREKPGVDQK